VEILIVTSTLSPLPQSLEAILDAQIFQGQFSKIKEAVVVLDLIGKEEFLAMNT